MAVGKRLRFEVLRRDNHACRYCGATAPEVKILVDHVVPEALGGQSVPENLVACCEPCNSGKTSIAPDSGIIADVDADQLRWGYAMHMAKGIRRDLIEQREAYAQQFHDQWTGWTIGKGQWAKPVPLEGGWRSTVDKFFEHDVDPEDITYAIRAAMGTVSVKPDNLFRYFCGIVWNIIREIQSSATDIAVISANVDAELDAEKAKAEVQRRIENGEEFPF